VASTLVWRAFVAPAMLRPAAWFSRPP
jgi:hypothetical protein